MKKSRMPNLPESYYEAAWGTCRWCGLEVLNKDGKQNKRKRWHKECVHTYMMISNSRYARMHVKKRDGGICRKCNLIYKDQEWEVDHIIPIHKADRDDHQYWMLNNLQTLCHNCHAEKTKAENKERVRSVASE